MAKDKKDKNKTDLSQVFKKFFKIDVKTVDKQKKLVPVETVEKDGIEKLKPVVFPDRIERLYEKFLHANEDRSDSIKNRMQRYSDLSYMRYNSSVIGRAVKMYAFETTQADAQNVVINVISKDKTFTEYVYEFLEKIGITEQYLTDVSYNLALYGDAFAINVIDPKKGVQKIKPLSVFTLKDRIEFNASKEAEKEITQNQATPMGFLTKNYRNLNALADLLKDPKDNNYSKYFEDYLFGYELLGDIYLPPWGITHYRLFSSESEFYPFGRSMFINSLSPFRQLKALETLQQMARVINFPTEIFSIQTDETMTSIDTFEKINEAREQYLNLNLISEANREEQSIGRQIWTASGLIQFDMKSPGLNLNEIGDIEMGRENLVGSTDIPISFLIADKGGFGTTGISLLQQYKPFARSVYTIQSAILEEISFLIKIHLMITGDFDVNTPFELEMRYPVLEESSDRQRAKSDNIRLVNDIIQSITDAIGLGMDEKLPPEIIIDIFSKYSFMDSQDILSWAKDLKGAKDSNEGEENPTEKIQEWSIDRIIYSHREKISESVLKKLNTRLSEELIMEVYFNAQRKYKRYEGTKNGKHYLSSYYTNPLKDHGRILELLNKEGLNKEIKLNEGEN